MKYFMTLFSAIVIALFPAAFAGADDCEPNDGFASAVLLDPLPCVEIVGEIDPAGDTDYFRVDASGGENAWISTITDDDTVLYLYDWEGNLIESDDDDGAGLGSLIAAPYLPDPGTYYIKVKAYDSSDTFSYDLYLTVANASDLETEKLTNNDTAAASQLLDLDQWVTGSMSASTDVDWYRFTATAGQTLAFQFDDDPGDAGTGSFDAVLGLYSAAGATLLEEVDHEGMGPDEPEDLIYENPATRYLWLKISHDGASFTAGDYYLALSIADEYICSTPTPSPTSTTSPSPVVPTPPTPPATSSPVPTASPPPSPSPTQASQLIRILDDSFRPRFIRVNPGRTVAWRNEGSSLHTTTCFGEWNSGTMLPKDVFSHTFSSEGVYDYVCLFQPSTLTGRVVCAYATPTPQPTAMPSSTPESGSSWAVDFDGDGISDIGIFRESSGLWAIRGQTRSYFGGSGDEPVPADYDGDSTTEIAIFRESSGLWAVRGVTRAYFGSSSDQPLPKDYDGDGSCDIGIFRESSGLWAVRGITRLYFGGSLDEPVPGYYDGDSTADIGIFRDSSGLWAVSGLTRIYFGSSDDQTVPGDYDGDGAWDIAVFRDSSGLWAVRGITRAYFGSTADDPFPADYSGSGLDGIGIFRESSGLWAVRGVTRVYYGSAGDIPVTR